MDRLASRLVFASLLLGACSSSSGPLEDGDTELAMEERLVGGWDGASTSGTSVLLLREGLAGTLSTTHLYGEESEYQLSFSISGDLDEDDAELVVLNLACDEARVRPLLAIEPENEEPDPSPSDASGDEELPVEPDAWDALDCAGWGLQLECSLAGECGRADCNLFCDVVYFGDAFATAAIELATVEDELDHWQRV